MPGMMRNAMSAAANYAFANRQVITHRVREVLGRAFGELEIAVVYDVCHNIAKRESHRVNGAERELIVHRKGATRAYGPGHPEIPEAYRTLGQLDVANRLLDEAQAAIDSNDEQVWQSEIYKLRGDLLRAGGDPEAAEGQYTKALSVAKAQHAKSHELRVALRMADLWCSQDRGSDACSLLSPLLAWFGEGQISPDIEDARTLLASACRH